MYMRQPGGEGRVDTCIRGSLEGMGEWILVYVAAWRVWENGYMYMRQPGGEGRMDTCIRVAESFCPPETLTTLLISYKPI